ncbi:hypothetical protein, partial [Komagataeibacter rhaeticus]|uniref:hypothetical protein n=1 Tax=Komagataeibacter rhaeticus TaxID=215221 RepID=UPI0039ED2B16
PLPDGGKPGGACGRCAQASIRAALAACPLHASRRTRTSVPFITVPSCRVEKIQENLMKSDILSIL